MSTLALSYYFYFNTQKGGGIGSSSKLGPVMYTMARSMLWIYGYLDELFQKLDHLLDMNVDYGEIKRVSDTDVITKLFSETILKLGDHADLFRDVEAATMLEVLEEFEQNDGLVGMA